MTASTSRSWQTTVINVILRISFRHWPKKTSVTKPHNRSQNPLDSSRIFPKSQKPLSEKSFHSINKIPRSYLHYPKTGWMKRVAKMIQKRRLIHPPGFNFQSVNTSNKTPLKKRKSNTVIFEYDSIGAWF